MDPAAIYALGAYAITVIARAITPDQPGQQIGAGIIGNRADRILLGGLRRSRHTWSCF